MYATHTNIQNVVYQKYGFILIPVSGCKAVGNVLGTSDLNANQNSLHVYNVQLAFKLIRLKNCIYITNLSHASWKSQVLLKLDKLNCVCETYTGLHFFGYVQKF